MSENLFERVFPVVCWMLILNAGAQEPASFVVGTKDQGGNASCGFRAGGHRHCSNQAAMFTDICLCPAFAMHPALLS